MDLMNSYNNGDVLFHQIQKNGDKTTIKEMCPSIGLGSSLTIDDEGNLKWGHPSALESTGRLRETPLYFDGERVGMGRSPIKQYKFDIKVGSNSLETGFHIGDGSFGFSMGNGTKEGFIPEIIGMGSDENDAGLYFMGKTMSDIPSSIPLVMIGGISPKGNRPIFGITTGQYDKYSFLVDQNGTVHAENIMINELVSVKDLLSVVKEQQDQINTLKERINTIQKMLR